MSKPDPELRQHKQWLGLLQPVGLVVSPLALVRKQAVIDRDASVRLQAELRPLVDASDPVRPALLRDLPSLFESVLGWRSDEYLGGSPDSGRAPLPETLEVRLPELDALLRPTYAVPELPAQDGGDDPADDAPPRWLLLIEELEPRTPLDAPAKDSGRGWHASPQAKFERMLRELEVPIGLLCNGETLRLVYAPRGETSGHLSFPIGAMTEVANRPMLGALSMLLSADRLLGEADDRRLPALLEESRKYQNEVSTKLAEQVLGALIELLRGFGAADEAAAGELLGACAEGDPKHVYGGLLTVLLRLVFLLYAEDRGLLPDHATWSENYAVVGLFERLREDAGRYPDTMDQRYGAWAWLLSLFRLVFLGGGHGPAIHLPARKGQLFDPNEYPFLEGRPRGAGFDPGERLDPPRVSDGTIYRILRGLLVLDGERLSYRTLDVEQIGSVYESMMGYEVERATGPSIGLGKNHVVVDLEQLLATKPKDRKKWLKAEAEVDVTGKALTGLEQAETPEDAVAALQRRISKRTPTILAKGSLYLQPGEERRRTGSHYTPRELTEPIVRTTLRPVLEDLGPTPIEAQILALKVCDPAMGSGAFLVEACRQLAEQLKDAWDVHGTARTIPADEEPLLHARRLVAEHCLYGVDKNPFAVNLAKLSLWLVTLAKDHPFTFLDHALKCGDSLVGLTRRQIAEFRWDDETVDDGPLFARVREQVVRAVEARLRIHGEGEDADEAKRMWNEEAERALDDARLQGDAVIAAFFAEKKAKARDKRRVQLWDRVQRWHGGDAGARAELVEVVRVLREDKGVVPFHWEIEFPEVFSRTKPGLDSFVGNPPFIGGTMIGGKLGRGYHEHLVETHPSTTGLADIVAFFLRRCFFLLANKGAFGLIATNTVAQGDTRASGLEAIIRCGGSIYHVQRRYCWPGEAAVIVSIIHVIKGKKAQDSQLDGMSVSRISSFLLAGNADGTPVALPRNRGLCYLGAKVWGAGFIFEERPSGGASSLEELSRIMESDPSSRDVIYDYMGGQEFNSSPTQSPSRFAIDFGTMSESEARQWPLLFSIIEERVRPIRAGNKQRNYRENWWLHANRVEKAGPYLDEHGQTIAITSVSRNLCVGFVKKGTIAANTLVLVLLHDCANFAALQSRVHEAWARFTGSSMKDDLRYTTPCFDTFPRPGPTPTSEQAGQTYYDFRAALMIRNDEGLTKTYNRFHDPDETSPDILELRELHAAMDRAVLEAYGWHDLAARATCEFQLEYEEPEDDEGSTRKRKKKKPWRYKWPQEFHDEVLARLLELNQEYAERERLEAEAAKPAKGKAKSKKKKPRKKRTTNKKKSTKASDEQLPLLDVDEPS